MSCVRAVRSAFDAVDGVTVEPGTVARAVEKEGYVVRV